MEKEGNDGSIVLFPLRADPSTKGGGPKRSDGCGSFWFSNRRQFLLHPHPFITIFPPPPSYVGCFLSIPSFLLGEFIEGSWPTIIFCFQQQGRSAAVGASTPRKIFRPATELSREMTGRIFSFYIPVLPLFDRVVVTIACALNPLARGAPLFYSFPLKRISTIEC